MKAPLHRHSDVKLFHWLLLITALAFSGWQTQAGNCTPTPSGLVAWLPGEGNADDIVGANNGTLAGGAAFAPGEVGLGFRFDGSNSYVQIPDSNALKPSNVTVEAWVWLDPNLPANRGGEQIVFKKNTWSAWFEGYSLLKTTIDNGDGTFTDRFQFCVSRAGNQVAINSTAVVQRGVWYHVAGTYDGSQSKLYVNSELEASATPGFALDYDTTPIFVGTSGTWVPYLSMFGGIIDEVSIYSRALSALEIQAIYSAGSAGKCPPTVTDCATPPAGLVSWWPAEGNGNDVISGNNGVWAGFGSVNAYGSGEVGQTFVFDGTHRDRVDVGDPPNLQLQNFSIETWVKRSSATTVSLDQNFYDGSIAGPGGYIFGYGAGGYALVLLDDGEVALSQNLVDGTVVPPAVTDTNWHHVAVTKNGGAVLFYVDGVQQPTPSLNPYTNSFQFTSPVAIGSRGDGGGNTFYGLIDELSVYNRALSSSEIQTIYNAGSAGKCTAANQATNFLLNVDFGVGNGRGYSLKTGFAAVGLTTNDFWNYYDRNGSTDPYDWRYSGALTNLQTAGGLATTSGMSVSDAPGGYGTSSSDPMYADYVYPLDYGINIVTFTNLPPGKYDVLAYSADGNYELTVGASYGVKTTYDPNPTGVPAWTEAVQYARWQNVPVAGGQPLSLTVRNGVGGYAILSGVQLMMSSQESGVPVISDLSPVVGRNGTVVTISGNHFSALPSDNIVYFGAVRAEVLAASPTSLTVAVPAGATFAPVTVTVGGLVARSSQWFEPSFVSDGSSISGGSFAPSFNLGTGYGANSVVIADLDGDGKPDIALVTAGAVSIFRNLSTNSEVLSAAAFAPRVDLPYSANAYRLRAVDLDGDGKLDLIACAANDDSVTVFHNISVPGTLTTNSFEPAFRLWTGNDCRFATAADLDGDGRVDIVALNYGDSTISIFRNIGTKGSLTINSFAQVVRLACPGGPYEAVIADLHGNGKPDIAVANSDNQTVSIFQNVTTSGAITTNSFALCNVLPAPDGSDTIAAVDLDGDGILDLVIGSYKSETVSVFRSVGPDGSPIYFDPRVDFSTGDWTHTLGIADFNGDGRPEVGVVGELPSRMSIFQNLSAPGSFTTSSFAPRVDFGTGWNAWGLAAGDLNGDGRPDIVFCNSYDSNIQIYQNAVPFGSAPIITLQPTNQTVLVGGSVTFNAEAQGSLPLTYQWSFNTTNLVGATNASLTLDDVQLTQAGNYSVLASNSLGTAVSSNALLTVYVPATPPTILSQTPNQVVQLGNTAMFSVMAGGSEPLSYFWLRNNVIIPGATNSSYALANAQFSDSGSQFSCLVTNDYGVAASTNVALKVIDTIANDLCSGAIVIASPGYTNVQSTLKASSFGDPVPACSDGFGHGVWYQFTAPVAGRLVVDTFGSDFDTGLAIYGGSCDALTELACNDDFGGITSQVTLPTTARSTYYILAGGYGSDAGNLVLHLNHLTPPAFVVQPTNLDVVVSSNANFASALTGSLPMSLQWYFNNVALSDDRHIGGSQTPTLMIARVQTNDAGSYQLVASNILGVVTSSVAVLTPIILPPVITEQPFDQSVLVGSNATFSVLVAGTPPYFYQWSFNGSPVTDDGFHISGSATGQLIISNLSTADAGGYSLLVTNVSGATNSATAMLTVLVPPTISLNPVGRSVPPGLPTTFNAAASGIPAPTYQWQLNGTNIPGATGSSYSNAAVGAKDLGLYHLVASNSVGVSVSADAQLTFGPVAAWGRNLSRECLPPPGLSNVIAVAGSYGASFALRTDGKIVSWGTGTITNVPASATNVVAISVDPGNYGAAAVRADGSVVGWGSIPTPGPVLSNVVSTAVGVRYAVALRTEGTLATWLFYPQQALPPAGLNHLVAMAINYYHSLVLRNDGTVASWGTGPGANAPAGLAGVAAMAVGDNHSLVLKSNGMIQAWGSGTATNLPAGLTNITAISTETYPKIETLSLALRSGGRVVAWGENPYGETNPPAALSNLVSISVAAAPYHGLALVNDGSPVILHPPIGFTAYTGRDVTLQASAAGAQPLNYQWLLNGTNIPGATNTSLILPNVQFGDAGNYQLSVSNNVGTALSLAAPLTIVSNSVLTLLSQPGGQTNYQGSKITLGATVLGSGPLRYQWYFTPTNGFGNLPGYAAIPGATNDTLVFDPALALNTGTYYLAVSNQFAGITSAPAYVRVLFARAWGYGLQVVTNPPVNVTNAVALAMSYNGNFVNSYFALGANGKLTSWANSFSPYGETNVAALSNSFVTAIAGGQQNVLALKSDGTVYAWGYGPNGQTNPPTGLNNVVAIACGAFHDLALKGDGTIVGWGAINSSNYGQTTNYVAASNVVAIAAAQYRSVALRADGTVVSWGYTGDRTAASPPTATNIIAITAGTAFNAALRADGKVVQWGTGLANYPVPASLSNVVAISGASTHCTALKNDGTVVSWGYEVQASASNNVPADLANVISITSAGEQDIALFGTRAPAFTVQPWNRSVPANVTTNIILAAKCAGVQPVFYQWQLNGTNVPNATNDTLTLSNSLVFGHTNFIATGAYQLVASNAYGVVASKFAKVTTVYPLAVALDTDATPRDPKSGSLYNWTTSGNAQWFGETNITHDGVDAAQSGGIGALQESILQTTVGTNWSGSYTFWWKVSSEEDFDFLEFRVNGITQADISGMSDWQQASVHVNAYTNVIQWRYSKDASFDAGLDAAWVDQFAFVPDPPLITQQPVSQTVNLGTNVTLWVAATGPLLYGQAQSLRYQWWQNGHPIGPSSTSPKLALYNVGRAQAGTYSVTVTNFVIPNNSIVSSNAVLKVLVPQLLGSPVLLPDGSFQLTSSDANGGLLQTSDLENFEAQTSTNLMDWVTLPDALSLTNGMLLLQDNAHTNSPARFYRLLEH